jgi:hypothetical protein
MTEQRVREALAELRDIIITQCTGGKDRVLQATGLVVTNVIEPLLAAGKYEEAALAVTGMIDFVLAQAVGQPE